MTEITGYTFTGSRAAVEAVTAANATENNDYLLFGLWSDESDDGATDAFGAFASGGANYPVNVQNAVTGTANYSGKAAGAHHRTGEGVNWFDGNASLTANFGADRCCRDHFGCDQQHPGERRRGNVDPDLPGADRSE